MKEDEKKITPIAMDKYAEVLLAILPILIILLYHHWRWNKNSPIINWPVVGMLPGLISNLLRIHDFFTEILKFSDLSFDFKGGITNLNFTVTCNPEDMHYILSTNFANFTKGPTFKKIFDILGDGILAAESDSWKAQRKLIHSVFKDRKFQQFAEKTAQQKVEKGMFPILEHFFKQGLAVDLQDLLQRFNFDVTCILLFGFDPKSLSVELPHVPISIVLEEIEGALLQRQILPESFWKLQRWLQIGEEKKVSRAWKTFDNFIYHQISLKRELRKGITREKAPEKTDERCDLFASFMDLEEEKEGSIGSFEISDTFLRDSVLNLLAAGKDSTSAALSWFFWLVATNPFVEYKIREEIKAHLQVKEGEKWRFFNSKELNKLVYFNAALCESLRLYPPIPFNQRAAIQPDTLPSGHHVGRDAEIFFSNYAVGRMEKIWGGDCLDFKPERWISEQGELIQFPSYKYVVFGAGARACVGKDLALSRMKLMAAAVIWDYHLQVVEGHPISPGNSVILRMKHGLKVKVTTRYQ